MHRRLALMTLLSIGAAALLPASASANCGCGHYGYGYGSYQPGQVYYAAPTYSYAPPTTIIEPHYVVEPRYIVQRTYVERPTYYVRERRSAAPCNCRAGYIVNQGQYDTDSTMIPYRYYRAGSRHVEW